MSGAWYTVILLLAPSIGALVWMWRAAFPKREDYAEHTPWGPLAEQHGEHVSKFLSHNETSIP